MRNVGISMRTNMQSAFRRARERREQRSDVTGPRFELRHFTGTLCHSELLTRPLRIAHLTDLHVGFVTPMKVQLAAAQLTNALEPDLVMITGDFVCHSQLYLEDLAEMIGAFDAPTFGVLGNHDYWSGAPAVRKTLRKAGMEVLDNAHTVIEIDGQRLQIVGLDDAYTGHADQAKALKGLRNDLPTIGLSHIAEEADALWNAGVPLVLSGHTHGGQVTLAKLHELTLGRMAGHRYVHGLYGCREKRRMDGAVYVGAGIGASVMPVRLGDRGRREIALFEVGAELGTVAEHHAEQEPMPGREVTDKVMEKRKAKVARRADKRARDAEAERAGRKRPRPRRRPRLDE